MDFDVEDIYGPYGVLLRARLYAPDGSTVTDLALAESPSGTYSGTVVLSPDPAESTSEADDYEYEVREVTAQTSGEFDASTTIIIERGFYGYVVAGAWVSSIDVGVPDLDTNFGTRAGMELKCGATNLITYENINRTAAGTAQDDEVEAAIEDDLEEANADMAVAWREFTDIPLGYSETYELRWLNDTAEYGGVVKAWAGRNISKGKTEDVPQQIATALDEWARRLQMLRDGTALKDYYDDNADEDDEAQAGDFESVPLTFNDDEGVVDEFAGT